MSGLKSIGLFGGTFDPIHFGHLRAAEEVLEQACLDEMRLIPCNYPPHRTGPSASPEQRLNMVRSAVKGTLLKVDDREMQRSGPSYSVDTLMTFRKEFPKECLCMVVGVDAFLGLTTWYQWEKLIQLANIIVMCRKGWALPEEGPIVDFLNMHALPPHEKLQNYRSGKILKQNISSLDISASHIRTLIAAGQNPQFLVPDSVLHYIQDQRLYGYNKNLSHSENEEGHI